MNGAVITSWGLCLPDCPYIVPEVVCLDPPAVPQFGARNTTGDVIRENYWSSWFNLTFLNNTNGDFNLTHYNITRSERDKLYQPWIPYVSSELKEYDLSFTAESKDDHFNDVYQIMANDSIVEYKCPLGWVFQDSNNISHYAYCQNWTWIVDFQVEKPCVRKYFMYKSTEYTV